MNAILASTPPTSGDRRSKGPKAPRLDLDLPNSIAFAAPSRLEGPEGASGAHLYRPSKFYHIYGGSVNPVARAKLEKRLRRVHTIHTVRRAGRMLSQRAESDDPEPLVVRVDAGAADPEKPRSLESAALSANLHYDAMEHLEDATLEKLPGPRHRPAVGEDELGGLIAHIGEGGEAVVDETAVEDVEFERGPVFDRKGRQRARIVGETVEPRRDTVHKPAAPAHKQATVAKVIHDKIDDVEGRPSATPKTSIAKSADRSDPTAQQKAKVERWLKHTLAATDIDIGRGKPKAAPLTSGHADAHESRKPAPAAEPKHPPQVEEVAPEPSAHATTKRAKEVTAPAFEVTHGSAEVEAEASSSDGDAPAGKLHKTASEILKEMKAQKRAEEERRAQAEAAKASKKAKEEADEIERRAREAIPLVALHATGTDGSPPEGAPAKRRRRSDGLESVTHDSEKLSGDLELTLSPIREDETIRITEAVDLSEAPSRHARAANENLIPMVGEPTSALSVEEAVEQVVHIAEKAVPHEIIESDTPRDVKPDDMVLAGPSTDRPQAGSDEAFLSDHERDKVAKRLEEGWNRM